MSNINENIQKLVESSKYSNLNDLGKLSMQSLLQQTLKEHEKTINEGNFSGDIAQFTPILLPLVRRVYPNLIANELVGVQPMKMSTGYLYAVVNQYVGDGNNPINPNSKGVIVELNDIATVAYGDTDSKGNTVVHVEDNKVLLSLTGSATPAVGDTIGTETVKGIYTNEAAFGKILKNYSGTYATGAGEKLAKDMKEVGMSISRKSIEAKTRALKGRYTLEMYQDLKSQHGLLADEELMRLISSETQAEIDREIVDFVNNTATQLPNTIAFSSDITDGRGRWDLERFRSETIRIAKEAARIGVDTKRGQGNTLLVSPTVATMLSEVGGFKLAPKDGSVALNPAGGFAGIFDNKYKVIVDQYADTDYCTVLYKGQENTDALGFFCPYVPLQFTKVDDYESGQPAIIAKTRYALSTIPGVSSADSTDRAEKYARSFGLDFTNTVLG